MILLLAAALLATAYSPATAQESISVLDTGVTSNFPQAITFHISAQAPSPIVKAEVRFATEQRACAPVETSSFADFLPSTTINTAWMWDLRQGGSLPPGATVQYQWLVQDQAGDTVTTPWQTYKAQDTRHVWKQMTRGAATLYWYQGNDAFANTLMDAIQAGLTRLDTLAHLKTQGSISFYIYASNDDLLNALIFPEEWTGGVTFTGFNIVAIGIDQGSLAWGTGAVAHEETHVLLDQATFNCLSSLPTWLNEGLATYNEVAPGQPQPMYTGPLQDGIRSGHLLSVTGLSGSFPTDSNKAALAYGESNSLAAYLTKTYGPEKLRSLLDSFQQGMGADAALQTVYGFDQQGLDALWRAYIGASPAQGQYGSTSLPLPTPVLPPITPYAVASATPAASPTLVAAPTSTTLAVPTPTATLASSARGGCNGGLPPPRTPTPTATLPLVATPSAATTPLPAPSATPFPTPTASAEKVAGVPRSQALVLAEDEPGSLDPALSQDTVSHEYVAEIFSSLVRLDQNLLPAPDLAASWEALDGGTRFVFHLRSNARFHSGRQVTAQDVAYSLERATDPGLASPTASTYLSDIAGVPAKLAGKATSITGIRVLDSQTIEIKIDAPKAYFLAKLTYPVADVVDKQNVESGPDWSRSPNGTGPFRLKSWQAGQQIVLERNTSFYRPTSGVPYVVFRFLAGVPMNLYETGDIDVTQVAGGNLSRILDPASGLDNQLRAYGQMSINYIGFNTAKPPFDDPMVRKAFAMALDLGRLISPDNQAYVQEAAGLLPAGMPGATQEAAGLPYNPQAARQLLARSKYGGPQGLPPIVYTSAGLDGINNPFLGSAVQIWKANLGVDVSVRLIPPDQYFTRLSSEVDNLYDFGWIADYPDPENILDVLFHTGAANNIGGYSNQQADALLEQARIEQDPVKRLALYRQAQDSMLQDAAAIPLWSDISYVLVKPYVLGYALTSQDVPTLDKVYLQDTQLPNGNFGATSLSSQDKPYLLPARMALGQK